MLRLFTILATIWHFGLDGMVLSFSRHPLVRFWCTCNRWRFRDGAAVRLRLALERLGPIFVKFGQLLSTRQDLLNPDFVTELEKLQDRVPPEKREVIRAVLEKNYQCDLDNIFSEFDETPVGSASVAQVHYARLKENGLEVAVKILRPNVERQIEKDIQLLYQFAWLVDKTFKESSKLKPIEIIKQFSKHLKAEMSLIREAASCTQIGRNLENIPELKTPKVYWDWCSEQVMVMEYIPAISISRIDECNLSTADKSHLAKKGIEIFFIQVFRDNFFHADMHPGNLHINQSGQFVLLDYGIMGQLTDFDKDYLLRNFLAFFNRDYRQVAKMHIEAGWVPPHIDIGEFEAEIRAVSEPIFSQPLKNISFGKFLLKMFQTARKFELEVQPQLILLQKTLFSIESIGRRLDPDLNLWESAKPTIERWAKKERHPRSVLRLLQHQFPDWIALLKEAPYFSRSYLQRMKQIDDKPVLEKKLNRWRMLAIVSFTVVVTLLFSKL